MESYADPNEYELFHRLWSEVAERLKQRENISDEDKRSAIARLKAPFFDGHYNSEFSNINFDEPVNCYAYMIWSATMHTCLMKFATGKLLSRHPDVFFNELTSSGGRLSVVSLGGGPGNDAIGFCRALAEQQSIQRVDVLNLDKWNYWGNVQEDMVNEIGRDPNNFFHGLNCSFRFEKADLVSNASRYHLMRIWEADVILIMKLVSILKKRDGDAFLQDVIRNTRKTSTIIYVDTQAERLWHQARDYGFEPLMKPEEVRLYRSNGDCWHCIRSSKYQICVVRKKDCD